MSADEYQHLIVEDKGSVRLIQLNRSPVNALSIDLFTELTRALVDAQFDGAIGAVVITGNERFFSAGADIKEMQDLTTADVRQSDFIGKYWSTLQSFEKPLIAAVAGKAFGGGFEQVLKCEHIIAADNAEFALPEVTLGTIPGDGGIQRLMHRIDPAKAVEMVVTGRFINAAEALEIGLVSQIVTVDMLIPRALALAAEVASSSEEYVSGNMRSVRAKLNGDTSFDSLEAIALTAIQTNTTVSPSAVHTALDVVQATLELSLFDALERGRELFYGTFDSPDFIEGRKAFTEKPRRAPIWVAATAPDESRDIIIDALSTGSWPASVDRFRANLPETGPVILTTAEAAKVLAHSKSDHSFCASLLIDAETTSVCRHLRIVVNGSEHSFADGLTEIKSDTGRSLVAEALPQTPHPERFIAGLYQGIKLPLSKPLDKAGNTIAHLVFTDFLGKREDFDRCATELASAVAAQKDFSVWQQLNGDNQFPLDLLLRVPPNPTEHFTRIQTIVEQNGCSRFYAEQRVYSLTERGRLGERLTENNIAWRKQNADRARLVI